MITYLQVKAERALIISALVTMWGALMAVQGAVLVVYPLYQTVFRPHRYHSVPPPVGSL
ncbi:MAG: hypothetical protein U1F76_17965 [Candidatus Competibacteraceae bacterium]